MAEAEQTFIDNDEQQNFSLPDSDQNELTVQMFDQQNITGDIENEYNFPENDAEDLTLVGHEQSLTINEPENDSENENEQNDSENENEQTLDGEQLDEGFHGIEFKQDFPENETNETDNVPDDSSADKLEEHEKNSVDKVEEKKWPGWPGQSVFRMVVSGQKVGNLMGRKGEYIKKIVEETKARVKVMDGPPGSQERAVMISAKEEPDSSRPPAIEGLLRVHRRIVDGLDDDPSQAPPAGTKVSTKFLVPATQAGILIGKQGATVKTIQENSSCMVRVLGQETRPAFALSDDRVVEVVGEPAAVHKAVELIASYLRTFLVDRSIIPVFEHQMQAPRASMEHMPPHPGPWGPPQGLPFHGSHGHGYGPGPQYMPPPPRQPDNYYQPAVIPPPLDQQAYQGMPAYGKDPPLSSHASYNAQSAPSVSTQVTQLMQIPLQYADTVIGSNGSTISYVRRASGATVTIQESKTVPGDMTAEINGNASQVQTAQQLIQNFMADAAASTAAPVQTGGAVEQPPYSQGYNAYAPLAPVYGTTPANATQPGAYGSVYGGNYGY